MLHGDIREWFGSCETGAFIGSVIRHGEESDEEAIIYTGEDISLYHSDDDDEDKNVKKTPKTYLTRIKTSPMTRNCRRSL